MVVDTITLLRGKLQDPIDPRTLVISCGLEEPEYAPGSYLHLLVPPAQDKEPALRVSENLESLCLLPFDQGFQVEVSSLDLTVVFGLMPWWKFPDFDMPQQKRVMYVPFRGWRQSVWFDGPLAHYVKEGCLSSFVPTGAPAKLSLARNPLTPAAEVIPYVRGLYLDETMRWLSYRTSLAFALKDRLEDRMGSRHVIGISRFDSCTLALTCLLRIAFPDENFETETLPQDADLKVAWKRLCQNLDILCEKAPRPAGSPIEIHLDDYRSLLPEHLTERMLKVLNHHSPIIPHRLMASLQNLSQIHLIR